MRYVRVEDAEDGGSRFVDVDVPQQLAPFAEGVPPVLVGAPVPASAVVFVDVPDELTTTEPHRAPRRQFVMPLLGRLEVETTDGEVRSFGPGDVVLVEDTTGRGHITRVIDAPVRFMAVPLADG